MLIFTWHSPNDSLLYFLGGSTGKTHCPSCGICALLGLCLWRLDFLRLLTEPIRLSTTLPFLWSRRGPLSLPFLAFAFVWDSSRRFGEVDEVHTSGRWTAETAARRATLRPGKVTELASEATTLLGRVLLAQRSQAWLGFSDDLRDSNLTSWSIWKMLSNTQITMGQVCLFAIVF